MIGGAAGADAVRAAGPPRPGGEAVDVVVLAGGTGRRLGGASKPDVVARGARLLDHVLAGLASLTGPTGPMMGPAGPTVPEPSESWAPAAGRVVVVAPGGVALPAGVLRALEDPPLGGPVAGIAAGLARLGRRPGPGPAALTAVVTCDAPESWRALPVLVPAAVRSIAGDPGSPEGPGDGACALEGDRVQYLLGVYRTAALARCAAPGGVALRDVSVRRALGGLAVAHVDLGDLRAAARDLDTWEDVRAWDRG